MRGHRGDSLLTTYAIIPVKPLARAKIRLAKLLRPHERRRLVLAMLSDVLSSVKKSRRVNEIIIVSRDPRVLELSRKHGVRYLDEGRGRGLNSALRRAVRYCVRAKGGSALIIPADIPLATARDFDTVIEAGTRSQVVIVPSHDEDGTNALLVSPPDAIPLAYGPDSFHKHLATVRARGIKTRTLRLNKLGLDIDDPQDLKRMLRIRGVTRTHTALRKLLAR